VTSPGRLHEPQPPPELPEVSLVVSTIGRPDQLRRLVYSLTHQRGAAGRFELIVVDQSEDGNCIRLLNDLNPPFDWRATTTEPGVSLGRNRGAALAAGDVLAFPDDDCWYPKGAIVAAAALTDSEAPVIRSGRLITADGEPAMLRWPDSHTVLDRYGVWRAALSSTMFVPRKVFTALGGFDEDLGVGSRTPWQAGEDTDLLLRAMAAGIDVHYEPAIAVHHDEHDPVRDQLPLKMRHYGQGIGKVLANNRFPRRYVTWLMARKAAAATVRRVSGRTEAAKADLEWAAGVWRGFHDRTAA
jgi:glycosyltransferase involved in cell wall biosynthesis